MFIRSATLFYLLMNPMSKITNISINIENTQLHLNSISSIIYLKIATILNLFKLLLN